MEKELSEGDDVPITGVDIDKCESRYNLVLSL